MTTPPSRTALEVVRAGYAALADGDVPALLAVTSPEIAIYQTDRLPYGGRFRGHDGFLRFLSGVQETLDSQVELGELFVAGERVVQAGRTRGLTRTTGKPFDAAEVHVWTVRDGLVVAFEAYVDTTELGRALSP